MVGAIVITSVGGLFALRSRRVLTVSRRDLIRRAYQAAECLSVSTLLNDAAVPSLPMARWGSVASVANGLASLGRGRRFNVLWLSELSWNAANIPFEEIAAALERGGVIVIQNPRSAAVSGVTQFVEDGPSPLANILWWRDRPFVTAFMTSGRNGADGERDAAQLILAVAEKTCGP